MDGSGGPVDDGGPHGAGESRDDDFERHLPRPAHVGKQLTGDRAEAGPRSPRQAHLGPDGHRQRRARSPGYTGAAPLLSRAASREPGRGVKKYMGPLMFWDHTEPPPT